jgi:predicted nucleic acid-binding protein
MITADTSVWIDYFNGKNTEPTKWLDDVLNDSSHDLVVLDVVLMEVLRGYRYDQEMRLADISLSALPIMTAGGVEVARLAASMYRNLRTQGITIRSSIDLLVGAWCIENDCPLIHNDRDYTPMHLHHGLPEWRGE